MSARLLGSNMPGRPSPTERVHRWGEWIAWPVWAIVCFLLAIIAGGIAYSVIDALVPGLFAHGTLGDFVVNTLVYGVIIGLMLSIVRTKRFVALRGATPAVRAAVPVGLVVLAGLLLLGHVASWLTLMLAAVVAGLLVVFSQLAPERRRVTTTELGIGRTVSWSDIGLGVAGYVVYFVVFIVMTMLLMKLVPTYNSAQPQDLGFTTLTGIERIVGFVVLVVITPLAEEFIMRGFLFGKLRAANMPMWPAAVVVSLMFGLAHGQWNVGVDTFILSMVACYLREMTGTIWPGVVIHMAKNAVAYIALFILMLK